MRIEYENKDKTPLLTIGAKNRKHLEVAAFHKDRGAQVLLIDNKGMLRASAWVGKRQLGEDVYWAIAELDRYQRGVERDEILDFVDTVKFTKAYEAAMQ